MRIFTFPVACDVCGDEGLGTIETASAAWDPRNRIAHRDPRICRDVLDRRRREIEKREKQQEGSTCRFRSSA